MRVSGIVIYLNVHIIIVLFTSYNCLIEKARAGSYVLKLLTSLSIFLAEDILSSDS